MQKQIAYPTLIPRLFATTIDLLILLIIVSLLKNLFHVADPNNYSGSIGQFLIINILINIISMGVFFISLWIYKNTTPGKIIMHMKIVDAKTLEPPSKYQLIKRFLAYPTALIGGILFVRFTKQRQALHDKIAGTAVIKS